MVEGLLAGVSNAHFSAVGCGISLPAVCYSHVFSICVHERYQGESQGQGHDWSHGYWGGRSCHVKVWEKRTRCQWDAEENVWQEKHMHSPAPATKAWYTGRCGGQRLRSYHMAGQELL